MGRIRDAAVAGDLEALTAMSDAVTAVVARDADAAEEAAVRLRGLLMLPHAEYTAAAALEAREADGDGERRIAQTRSLLATIRRELGRPLDAPVRLTERETEIARLVASGATNREIAGVLYLSVRTVESHVYQALTKLGGSSRREMDSLLASHGIAERAPESPAAVVQTERTTAQQDA